MSFATKSFTYYGSSPPSTDSVNTPFQASENLTSKYAGTTGSNAIWSGSLATETIGGCGGCGTANSVTKSYFYMNNVGTTGSPIAGLVVEDTQDSAGTAVYRTVYRFENRPHAAAGLHPEPGEFAHLLVRIVGHVDRLRRTRGGIPHAERPYGRDDCHGAAELPQSEQRLAGTNANDTARSTVPPGKSTFIRTTRPACGPARRSKTARAARRTMSRRPTTATASTRSCDGHLRLSDADDHPFQRQADQLQLHLLRLEPHQQVKTKTTTLPTIPTGQNGSGVATTTGEYYDNLGRLRWTQDGEGYINYLRYHPSTGAVGYQAVDVDPASPRQRRYERLVGQLGSGYSRRGQLQRADPQLLTADVRWLWRRRRITTAWDAKPRSRDTGGNNHYTAYANLQTIQFPFWNSTTSQCAAADPGHQPQQRRPSQRPDLGAGQLHRHLDLQRRADRLFDRSFAERLRRPGRITPTTPHRPPDLHRPLHRLAVQRRSARSAPTFTGRSPSTTRSAASST